MLLKIYLTNINFFILYLSPLKLKIVAVTYLIFIYKANKKFIIYFIINYSGIYLILNFKIDVRKRG